MTMTSDTDTDICQNTANMELETAVTVSNHFRLVDASYYSRKSDRLWHVTTYPICHQSRLLTLVQEGRWRNDSALGRLIDELRSVTTLVRTKISTKD